MFSVFKKKTIAADKMPQHIALVCDGNRRWAKSRGISAMMGHHIGAGMVDGSVSPLVDWFFARGVSTLTFYIFSTENWTRTTEEVSGLMKLFADAIDKYGKDARQKNIRVRVIGRRDRIPVTLVKKIEKLEQETSENTTGTVVFALDHGGHEEIIRAVNMAIKKGKPVNEKSFETFMDSGDLPPVDMMVRTSNEQRTSNYLLWKNAYAELFFVPEHWPEFINSKKSWQHVMDEYARRNRRFGGGVTKNYGGKK
jgi:undecaprenyl diphosphate synthase